MEPTFLLPTRACQFSTAASSFADGVYEVAAVIGGRLIDNEAHLSRLERSLRELRIESPRSDGERSRTSKPNLSQETN